MTDAMSNNNDCYCRNPVDLENNLMFAGLPNHSPLLRGPAPKKRPMTSGSKIESADF